MSVTRAYLHSDLRQVDLQRQLLPAVHVRVVGLLERPLQLVQLERGERRPVPTVLLLGVLVVGQFAVPVRGVRADRGFGGAAGATSTCADGTGGVRMSQTAGLSECQADPFIFKVGYFTWVIFILFYFSFCGFLKVLKYNKTLNAGYFI